MTMWSIIALVAVVAIVAAAFLSRAQNNRRRKTGAFEADVSPELGLFVEAVNSVNDEKDVASSERSKP